MSGRLRTWHFTVLMSAVFVVVLWANYHEIPAGERAERLTAELAEDAPAAAEAANVSPVPEHQIGPERDWRLEVEIRDEEGKPIRGVVYVTSAGGVRSIELTRPPTPLAQIVKGSVDVIVFEESHAPQHFGPLLPPPAGVQAVVAQLERGPGIEGRVFDEVGVPVTRQRAGWLRIRAYPLDTPPWLSEQSASWYRVWGVRSSRPREDGSFRIEGLLPGKYEIRCDPPDPELDTRPGAVEPLLQLEPVVARVGDTHVRIECVRAVEVRVWFTDSETGSALRILDRVVTWRVMAGDQCLSSGSGAVRGGVVVTAQPGTELTFTAKIEGYLNPGPLRLIVNREPGCQEAALAFRSDVGAISVLELTVLDDLGRPVYPLMVGRTLAGMVRLEDHAGHYSLGLPAGVQTVHLESPSDQLMLFTREWVPSSLDPDGYADARAYLPVSFDVDVPRGDRLMREIRMQRAAFIWIRSAPTAAFGSVRVLHGETEMKGAIYELYEERGLAAAVQPGNYTVEGRAGEKTVRVAVVAKEAEVAEVWLRAEDPK